MADEAGEKKHEPGDKKWRDSAERGELPRSPDINATAVVVTVTAGLVFLSRPMTTAVQDVAFYGLYAAPPYELDHRAAWELIMFTLVRIGWALSVPLLIAMAASTLASLGQTGLQLAPKALEPKFERLDVVTSFQQMYLSWTPLVELAKALAKIFVIALAVGLVLWPVLMALPEVMGHPPEQLMQLLVLIGFRAVLAATPVMVAVAIIDYAYSYNRSYEQLKRTDRELREDQKAQEGDPRFKSVRRQRARKIAMSVSLQAVRDADVVVTNPTHYAVALRYRRGEDFAPTVLAKGVDVLAQRIRQEALRHGVPRVEHRTLARALYAEVEPGEPVPEELYAPVAKVLAVVFRRRMSRRLR